MASPETPHRCIGDECIDGRDTVAGSAVARQCHYRISMVTMRERWRHNHRTRDVTLDRLRSALLFNIGATCEHYWLRATVSRGWYYRVVVACFYILNRARYIHRAESVKPVVIPRDFRVMQYGYVRYSANSSMYYFLASVAKKACSIKCTVTNQRRTSYASLNV